MMTGSKLRSSLRALLGAWAGDRIAPLPEIPDGIPDTALNVIHEAVATLVHYQGVAHARLYLHRLRRFVGRRDIDETMLTEIALRMCERMTYDDPVRLAQLTLDEARGANHPVRRHCRFRLDELLEPLPTAVAKPIGVVLARSGSSGRLMTRRYTAGSRLARMRLKIEASLRFWRALGHAHERERLWVERWLHMIDRALTKQPDAAPAIIDSASMIRGYGEPYRRALADWHLIIDGLAKPTFDGTLPLPNLATAIARARRATIGDIDHVGVRATIAEIRKEVLA